MQFECSLDEGASAVVFVFSNCERVGVVWVYTVSNV